MDTSEIQNTNCEDCGRSVSTDPITLKTLFGDVINVIFNVEKGFLYTIKELTVNPGLVISNYLSGVGRYRYYNPFRYAFVVVTVSTLLFSWAGYFDDVTAANTNPNPETSFVDTDVVKDYSNLLVLPLIPFCSLATWLLFRRKNLAEHLVINFFIFGHVSLFGFPQILLYLIVPESTQYLPAFSVVLLLTYLTIVYRKLYSKSALASFLLTTLSVAIGMVFFSLAIGFGSVVFLMVREAF